MVLSGRSARKALSALTLCVLLPAQGQRIMGCRLPQVLHDRANSKLNHHFLGQHGDVWEAGKQSRVHV